MHAIELANRVNPLSRWHQVLQKALNETIEHPSLSDKIQRIFLAILDENIKNITIQNKSTDVEVIVDLHQPVKKRGNLLKEESVLYIPSKIKFTIHKNGVIFDSSGTNAPYEQSPNCSFWKKRWTWCEFTNPKPDILRRYPTADFILDLEWWQGPFYPCCGGTPWGRLFSAEHFHELPDSFN